MIDRMDQGSWQEGGEQTPLLHVTTYTGLTAVIRAVMEDNDLTIETVARRAGMATSTVGAYHSGKITGERARPDTLRKLARGLRIDPGVLFDAAGIGRTEERTMIALFRQLPSDADRKQALTTLRAHVAATRRR